jgi:membrane protein YqaA with SNARE-associated domain
MGNSCPAEVPPGGEVELRLARREPLRLRDWFVPFFALLAVVLGIFFLSGKTTTAGHLALLFGYLSLACTFLPLPTAWLIIWAGAAPEVGGMGLSALVVATVGSAATAVGNMHDYYLLTYLYKYEPVRKIRATGLYRRVAAWYNRAPFGTLAAASFLPIPIDFVRLLAISEGYSRVRFVAGTVVGRWPRYFLLAFAADQFKLGWQWILGIAGATVVLGLWRGLPPLVRKLRERARARRAAKEGSSCV